MIYHSIDEQKALLIIKLSESELAIFVDPKNGGHRIVSAIGLRRSNQKCLDIYNDSFLITSNGLLRVVGEYKSGNRVTQILYQIIWMVRGARSVEMTYQPFSNDWGEDRDHLRSILPKNSVARPFKHESANDLIKRVEYSSVLPYREAW